MLSHRSTPVILSQEAARGLPRWSLLILLLVFAATGFWTDLWTARDGESFSNALSVLTGTAGNALLPSVLGEPVLESGPLNAWLNALFIKLFGTAGGVFAVMSDVAATRLSATLWFLMSVVMIWYGTWHLARRPEAQPVAFAFGGEATVRDYSRMTAGCAVLLFVSTFGIVTRQHEAIPGTAMLAAAALNFYGLARTPRHRVSGPVLAGAGAALAVLADTLFVGITLLAASAATVLTFRRPRKERLEQTLRLTLAAVLGVTLWPAAAMLVSPEIAPAWFASWLAVQLGFFGIADADTFLWFLRNCLWFYCPVLPLVLWAVYSWRRQILSVHTRLPLTLIVVSLIAVLFSGHAGADRVFLSILPPAAALAAFGVVTLRRGRENVLDWFSLTIFTLGLLFLWTYWFAWLTDFAPKMRNSVLMFAPGSSPVFDSGLLLGALTTFVWILFVVWRLTHRPVVCWRGPWLCASGLTACAAAAIGLFHTAIDMHRSYEPVAQQLNAALTLTRNEGDCISTRGVPAWMRVLLTYYGMPQMETGSACRFTILRERTYNRVMPGALTGGIHRPHSDETFFIIDSAK